MFRNKEIKPLKPTDEVHGQADIARELMMPVRTFRYWKGQGFFDSLTKVTSGRTGRGPRVDTAVVQSLWPVGDAIEARVQASKGENGRRPRPGSKRHTFPIQPIGKGKK